ncbi:PfkB family carbohydrate kinase [Dactylosporangium sp. NPDC049525]|uniref:carbohydrate kinase family protein n=1 Tax=Dactylosporangium sp. NPDC049525 TaxID=3154730 RepID=UPI00342F5AE1
MAGPGHERSGTLTIVGDVRLDIRSMLPAGALADTAADTDLFAPMTLTVAGTAANLASFAVQHFAQVNVIAGVGDDFATAGIRDHLQRLGVGQHLFGKPGHANATTVILRMGDGARVMVSSDPSPNHLLSVEDIDTVAAVLAASDLVFTEGHFLRGAASRPAVHHLVDVCAGLGVPVCFDLVPHDLAGFVPLAELAPLLARCSVAIASAQTAAALLGRPGAERQDDGFAWWAAEQLTRVVGADTTWLIRWGPTNIEQVVSSRPGAAPRAYATGYELAAEKTAYGDRVAAAELWCWLNKVDLDAAMLGHAGGARGQDG